MVLENILRTNENFEFNIETLEEQLCIVVYNTNTFSMSAFNAKKLYEFLKNYFDNEKGETE